MEISNPLDKRVHGNGHENAQALGKRTDENNGKLVSSKELENTKNQTELENTITERKRYTGRNQQ